MNCKRCGRKIENPYYASWVSIERHDFYTGRKTPLCGECAMRIRLWLANAKKEQEEVR